MVVSFQNFFSIIAGSKIETSDSKVYYEIKLN